MDVCLNVGQRTELRVSVECVWVVRAERMLQVWECRNCGTARGRSGLGLRNLAREVKKLTHGYAPVSSSNEGLWDPPHSNKWQHWPTHGKSPDPSHSEGHVATVHFVPTVAPNRSTNQRRDVHTSPVSQVHEDWQLCSSCGAIHVAVSFHAEAWAFFGAVVANCHGASHCERLPRKVRGHLLASHSLSSFAANRARR